MSNDSSTESAPIKSSAKVRNITIFAILIFLGFVAIILKYLTATPYFKIASNFIQAPGDLISSDGGRTNILIMGVGGMGHEGADLTDTMLVASVSLTNPSIVLISIPRDIWIPEIRAKLNSAYYWGNKNTPYFQNQNNISGIPFAKFMAEKVLGIPIQYGVVLDLSAFEKIVNDIGGIEIKVERSFTDKLYPIAGHENDICGGDPKLLCRYETVNFVQGRQLMDGATALKFVRSRHAEGEEGSDIAREARQQKVIAAIEQKISKPEVFLNLGTDIKLWNDINSSIFRDIDDPTGAILARKIFDAKNSVTKYLIPENLLFNPPISASYDFQYVFIPKAGKLPDGTFDWSSVHEWVKSILK